jgi:hypothetical protein
MVEVKVVHTAIERSLEERIMTSRPPRPDPIRSRPGNDAMIWCRWKRCRRRFGDLHRPGSTRRPRWSASTSRSPARQHDRSGWLATPERSDPPDEPGDQHRRRKSVEPTGLQDTHSMSTLPAITYVVQGRSNTVGVLSIRAGWEEGLARLGEPGRTIEDGGRSLPRFAS